jgi:cation transport regulator ChaC
LIEQSNAERWLVAYGSNMSLSRIAQRVGKVKSIVKGNVEQFRLAFNKCAANGAETFANLIFTGEEESCPVVAYRLTEEQIEQLDIHEGVPQHYRRSTVWFTPEEGESILAETYLASMDKLIKDVIPGGKYLKHIYTGYKEHGLDHKYLDSILAHSGVGHD